MWLCKWYTCNNVLNISAAPMPMFGTYMYVIDSPGVKCSLGVMRNVKWTLHNLDVHVHTCIYIHIVRTQYYMYIYSPIPPFTISFPPSPSLSLPHSLCIPSFLPLSHPPSLPPSSQMLNSVVGMVEKVRRAVAMLRDRVASSQAELERKEVTTQHNERILWGEMYTNFVFSSWNFVHLLMVTGWQVAPIHKDFVYKKNQF